MIYRELACFFVAFLECEVLCIRLNINLISSLFTYVYYICSYLPV